MCGTVTKPARHSAIHPGEIARLAASSTAQPTAVRQLGNAPNSARPIVGFATRRNPAAGRSAAPASSSDHCAVCSVMSAGSETRATTAGGSAPSFVTAHVKRPHPRAPKIRSAQCIDANASGVIVSTAVMGYMSGNVVLNQRPGPTDAYGSCPCIIARAPAHTGATSECIGRGVLQKIQTMTPAVTATASVNAVRHRASATMERRCLTRMANGLQMVASTTAISA